MACAGWVGLLCVLAFPASGERQMERLGRGLIALRRSSTEVWLGWRWLGQDPADLAFNLYRVTAGVTNRLNSEPLQQTTDFVDRPPTFAVPHTYFLRPVRQGTEMEDRWAHPLGRSLYTLPANPNVPTDSGRRTAPYLAIPLDVPPAGTTPDDVDYTYSPNDCSPGDLDGDGEYELVVKWDPSNSKDNSQSGYTGNVYLDAYRMDGTRLWRIDLGRNIRAGAHYTQFMVYDLDGDGRAEVACRTAPGTRDGLGRWVLMPGDNPLADYRNSSGYILSGPEYLTIFDGRTGAALWTTNYLPPRGPVSAWGDSYGNRVDRFLACVAYLDGIRPSLVMCRGYYTRTVLVAWDWRDGQLTRRWTFDSNQGWPEYAGQGNHNLSVADVDGDGRDEIVYGACVIDDDGRGLYSTGWGHGDAMHVSDMDPDHPGLEVWQVHETPSAVGGGSFRDAATGTLLWGLEGTGDTGRGLASPIDGRYRGYQFWSSASPGVLDRTGQVISSSRPSINFAVWWDADVLRELHDSAGSGGTAAKLDKWTGDGVQRLVSFYSVDGGALNINGTKANPCLSGDLVGDWREEILLRSADNTRLMLFVSVVPATNRFRTLLHDPQYRLALAWQNVAYNQPPHPGFYVGPGMDEPPLYPVSDAELAWTGGPDSVWGTGRSGWVLNHVWTQSVTSVYQDGQSVVFDLRGAAHPRVVLGGELRPSSVRVHAPVDFEFLGGSLAGPMSLLKAGSGDLKLPGLHTFAGPTEVSEGGLILNGLLAASPVRVRPGVWLNSRLGGTGVAGAGAVLERGCILDPGPAHGLIGTLTFSNHLVLRQARLWFDLSSQPPGASEGHDQVRVHGALHLEGTNRVTIRWTDVPPPPGIYPLIEFTGPLTGSLSQLEWEGEPPLPGLQLALLPGAIALVIPEAPPDEGRWLVWRGAGSDWDVGRTANWTHEGQATVFWNGDRVRFDNSGSQAPVVNLVEAVAPALVVVEADVDYQFTGTGSLTGTNRLVKSGTGTLVLATTNTFSGGLMLSNGVVALSGSATGPYTANQYAVGSGPIQFYGGTLQLFGHGERDNTATYGALTNLLLVPPGQTGTIRAGPRQTLASRVLGGGTLDLFVDYVRGEVTGDWTAFNGLLRVHASPGTRASSNYDDFRVGNPAGFPLARVHLGSQVALYSRAPAGSVIPIGSLSADEGARMLAGSGSGLGAQNPVTWRVGGLNESATNRALIRGNTSLIKEGSGTWTLTATNDYSGPTTVNAGRLVILGDQRAATGAVTVASGASLGGSGVVGGPARVWGTLYPGGTNPVVLGFARDLTLEGSALTVLKLAPRGHDRIVVEGTCMLNGRLQIVRVTPEPVVAGQSFVLFQAAQIAGAFQSFDLPELEEGLVWRTERIGLDGSLWVVRSTPPRLMPPERAGDRWTLRAREGTPGWPVRLRRTTDLRLPVSQWEIVAEAQFDADGDVTFELEIEPERPAAFYRLEVP